MEELKPILNRVALSMLIFIIIGYSVEYINYMMNLKTESFVFLAIWISAFTYSLTRK